MVAEGRGELWRVVEGRGGSRRVAEGCVIEDCRRLWRSFEGCGELCTILECCREAWGDGGCCPGLEWLQGVGAFLFEHAARNASLPVQVWRALSGCHLVVYS